MKRFAAVVLLVAWLPAAGAQSGWVLGTQEAPELSDLAGDIQYSPFYVGARDHDYLDIAKAWFEYQEATDSVMLTFMDEDARKLASPSGTWGIGCSFSGNMTTEGEVLGRLGFSWHQRPNETLIRSFVVFETSDTSPVSAPYGRPLRHGFAADLEKPGVFRFSVERSRLLLLGDELADPAGWCYEILTHAGTSTGTIINEDRAASKAAYSFKELRQVRSPEGVYDPIERLPPESASPGPSPVVASESVAPGLLVVALAVLVGLAARGRRG